MYFSLISSQLVCGLEKGLAVFVVICVLISWSTKLDANCANISIHFVNIVGVGRRELACQTRICISTDAAKGKWNSARQLLWCLERVFGDSGTGTVSSLSHIPVPVFVSSSSGSLFVAAEVSTRMLRQRCCQMPKRAVGKQTWLRQIGNKYIGGLSQFSARGSNT